MKFFYSLLLALFLSSCGSTYIDQYGYSVATPEQVREAIPELFDPELKKGKIFIFSNQNDLFLLNIRVNDEVRKIKHTQTQIFDLKEGQNSVFSFKGSAVSQNCDDQPYTFDTKAFPEIETYYFLIQKGYNGNPYNTNLHDLKILCFKDFDVSEEAFLRQIENPRSLGGEATQALLNDFMNEFVF